MNAATLPFTLAPRRPLFGAEPLFAAAGAMIALSLAATVAAMAVDPRLFHGESVWIKPIKFQASLALYLLTLAVFAQWLPAGMTGRRWYRVYARVVVAAIALELAWIAGAAMYGTASHFNTAPAMMMVYAVMGVLAVVLTSASLVYGVAIWRNRASGLPPALHLAIALGLVLTFALTVPVAGWMSNGPGHLVGVPVTGATVPILGWSSEVGDLRVAHFFAAHAMHFLPVAGLAAVLALPERTAVAATSVGAALYVGLVAWSFAGALDGRPFLALG
jgi:hypothetical protein